VPPRRETPPYAAASMRPSWELLQVICAHDVHERRASTWPCNARFLSEVPRWLAYERTGVDEAGVLSIRALAVSRWCGVLDAASYGF